MVCKVHRLQARVWFVGATLCLALAGCGADEQSAGGPNNKPPHQAETLSTAQITGVIASINQGAIKQAELVVDRLEDDAVRQYAQKMISEHEAAEGELERLMTKLAVRPESSSMRTDFEGFTERLNRTITEETPARVHIAFLDAEIQLHRKALKTLDQLLAETQQGELRAYLENFRQTLQQHFEQGQQLRKRFPEMESGR